MLHYLWQSALHQSISCHLWVPRPAQSVRGTGTFHPNPVLTFALMGWSRWWLKLWSPRTATLAIAFLTVVNPRYTENKTDQFHFLDEAIRIIILLTLDPQLHVVLIFWETKRTQCIKHLACTQKKAPVSRQALLGLLEREPNWLHFSWNAVLLRSNHQTNYGYSHSGVWKKILSKRAKQARNHRENSWQYLLPRIKFNLSCEN